MKQLYNNLFLDPVSMMKNTWTRNVRDLLIRHGFGEAWAYQGVANTKYFVSMFKQRLYDMYGQSWHAALTEHSKASLYTLFKDSFVPSLYLDVYNWKTLVRFFTRNHHLNVEVGSWHKPNKIPYEQRYCFYCQDDIEDEFHFVLCCPIYKDVRVKYIKKYYRCKPSMFKFIQLCKTESKRELI